MTKCEGTRRVVPKAGASQQKWTILTGWKESVVYAVRSDTIAKTVRIGRLARPHKFCNTINLFNICVVNIMGFPLIKLFTQFKKFNIGNYIRVFAYNND